MQLSTSLFMEDWNAEPPDNGVGVENLADVDVALQEDWNAMPPGTTLE